MTEQTQAPDTTPQDDDPNVVGRLTDEEIAQWQQARQMGNQTVMELGNMVLRALRMAQQLDHNEMVVRKMLQGAAKRLGLADDVKFQALPDGRIRVVADIAPVAPPAQQGDQEQQPTSIQAAPVEEKEPEKPDDPMEEVARAKAAAAQVKEGATSPPPAT